MFSKFHPPAAQSDFLAEGLFSTEKDNHVIYGKIIRDIYAFI